MLMRGIGLRNLVNIMLSTAAIPEGPIAFVILRDVTERK